jgi:hypothetical protein
MRYLGSKCQINEYVTPWYYDILLVFQRCHIKEVRLYNYHLLKKDSKSNVDWNCESMVKGPALNVLNIYLNA